MVPTITVPAKYKSVDELSAMSAQARKAGRVVVFTNGCFDLVHRGHIHLLRQAKALGDLLIVGLNSDVSVKTIKGPDRPIMPEADRIELIAALEMVDYVVAYDEPDPYRVIAAIQPNVLVKGGDWTPDKIIGRETVEARGGTVKTIPLVPGVSTTAIVEKIKKDVLCDS